MLKEAEMEAHAGAARVSRSRRTAFAILTGLVGVLAGFFPLFGLPLAVLAWFESTDGGIHRFHDLGWAALMGILLAAPALAQLRRPESKIAAMQQIAVVILGIVLGYTVSGLYADPVHVVVLVILGTFIALHPAPGEFFRAHRPSLPLLAMMLLAAIPLLVYALDQAELQRTLSPGEPHWEGEHWADMAKVALAIPLVGLVAALRAPGFRIPAWCAGAAAALLGTASIVYPDQASSFGRGWGTVAVAGGLLFVVVAEWEAGRATESPRRFSLPSLRFSTNR
jgi:hypothetical protein